MTDRELMLALMKLIGKDNIRAREMLSERLRQPDWTIAYNFGETDGRTANTSVRSSGWGEKASRPVGLPA